MNVLHCGDPAIGHPGKPGGDNLSPRQSTQNQDAPDNYKMSNEFGNEGGIHC
jgi:hypothetical protein